MTDFILTITTDIEDKIIETLNEYFKDENKIYFDEIIEYTIECGNKVYYKDIQIDISREQWENRSSENV